ncbi:MAG: redoxin domain-containing protein [Candidatus Edwardsbacteria bacterium]|nr:redoxin domain-containing protein [Candidatus Edwardsbacteria bacterium]
MAQEPVKEQSLDLTGKPAPTFCLPDVKGNKIYLSDLTGKGMVIVLNFFATYCKPCRREMPELDSLVRSYPADSIMLVFIDGGEKRDTVLQYINNHLYDAQSIENIPKFIAFLKTPKKPVAKFLAGKLSEGTKKAIARYAPKKDLEKALSDSLARELNGLVKDPGLYRSDAFTKVKQSEQTAAFMKLAAKDVEITKLNRSLLDDALGAFVHPKVFFEYEGCLRTLLVDQYQLVCKKYGVADYPQTVIIDGAGIVAHQCAGYTPGNMGALVSALDSLFMRTKPKIKDRRKGK